MTTYDKTKPLGTEAANLLDDRTRDNFAAIEERLAKEHQFPDNPFATRSGRHLFGVGTSTQRDAAYPTPYDGAFWGFNTDPAIVSPQIYVSPSWRTLISSSTLLVGEMKPIANPQAVLPSGWFLCNGQELALATYPALYAACGGSANWYGTPSGAPVFVLPDMRGRVPVGYAPLDGDYNLPGDRNATGKTRQLAIGNMPAHDHGGVSGPQVGMTANAIRGSAEVASGSQGQFGTTTGINSHTHTVATQGSATAFDIRPEYLTIGYMIWSGVP